MRAIYIANISESECVETGAAEHLRLAWVRAPTALMARELADRRMDADGALATMRAIPRDKRAAMFAIPVIPGAVE